MGVSESEKTSLLLDERLLALMDQLELLEEKRASLNSLIEQGWFSMSKARYSMGNKQVSTLQYASEMTPLVCLHARALENGEMEFSTDRSSNKCCHQTGTDTISVEDVGPQEGVRRRINPKKASKEQSTSENAPVVPVPKKSDQNPQQDPLKWFGILVPQSLKQAQASFQKVIELSAEMATLQSAVLSSRQEMKRLLQDKASAALPDKMMD